MLIAYFDSSVRVRCGKQAVVFLLNNRVAFASASFECVAIKNRDSAAPVADQSSPLQSSSRFGNAYAAYAEHIGNEFLRHDDLIRIEAFQS